MAQFPQSFGTAFATAGFAFDPNLSPNNQSFANAVLATCQRAGLPFGFEPANVVLAGPAAGAAALPTYRALVAADVPASILPGGFNGFGNPSGLIGLAAVNGTSTLALRSDGLHALDQSIAPTWTAKHIFNAPGANAIVVNGFTGVDLQLVFNANATTNSAVTIYQQAAASLALVGVDAANNFVVGSVQGDYFIRSQSKSVIVSVDGGASIAFKAPAAGGLQGKGPVAGALVDMTPDTGSFNGTLASVTTVVTLPCVWARNGNIVVLTVGTGTGTSNANNFTIGGLPAAITPTRVQRLEVPDYSVENSGAVGSITTDVEMVMNTNGTMTLLNGGTATGWGATLFKGVAAAFPVMYILN